MIGAAGKFAHDGAPLVVVGKDGVLFAAFLGSEDFAKFLAQETPRWDKAVKASGARLD